MNQSDIPKLLGAIAENNLEPVIRLIESGELDVNAGNEHGDSLLHCAISFRRNALARLLIEKGADLNMTEEIQKKHPCILELLLIILEFRQKHLCIWQ